MDSLVNNKVFPPVYSGIIGVPITSGIAEGGAPNLGIPAMIIVL